MFVRFLLCSVKQRFDFKWRKNNLDDFPSIFRVTVDSYFRGVAPRLAELVVAAVPVRQVCSPHRYTMFQHYFIPSHNK